MTEFGTHREELREIQGRLTILKIGIVFVIGVLSLRIWHLQVQEGSYYRDLSDSNRTRSVLLQPVRGLIYDRHGVVLANNVPSFGLYVTLEDVHDRRYVLRRLSELIGLDEATAHTKLLVRGSKLIPRKVRDGLTLREAAMIESHRLELPGVRVLAESQRNYPAGTLAAHLLGYLGEVTAEQLEQPEFDGVPQGSMVGQYGVEKTFDRFIRGAVGEKTIETDAMGHEKQTVRVEKPNAGDDLYLTIDVRLQKLAEDLLGAEAGAIVALDPRNGEILAMASRPVFDPNVLSRELTSGQWAQIAQDEGHPLTNRAIQGQYPPGSTFKIVMAAAALETRTVTPSTTVHCTGGYRYGRRTYRDWKAGGHGVTNLHEALVDSCDVYFYTVGEQMGIETIAGFASQFGLGQETGVDLPSERTGIVPSPTWKATVKEEPWLPGETISASIGQGYVTVTPLQMARLMATVSQDGVWYRPRLVKGVMDRMTGRMVELPAVPGGTVKVKKQTLALIKDALEGVVTDGTGGRAKSKLVRIAGKTGTAQTASLQTGPEEQIPKKLRDHAWFVSYAPAEKPQIAVAVLVENMGHGGSAAAPLAKQMIEAFVKLAPRVPVIAQPFPEGAVSGTPQPDARQGG